MVTRLPGKAVTLAIMQARGEPGTREEGNLSGGNDVLGGKKS